MLLRTFSLFIILFLLGCDSNDLEIELTKPKPKVNFSHYDFALFETPKNEIVSKLDSLAIEYPIFINGNYKSSTNLNSLMSYIDNSLNQKLYVDAKNKLGELKNTEKRIEKGFHYFHQYFSNDTIPNIYFYISGLNYEEPIIVADLNNILIGKDLFLGSDYSIYDKYQVPRYISQRFDEKYMPFQIFRKYAYHKYAKYLRGENLLETMIALGKIEYFINAMFPNSEEALRMGFTPTQMNWCLQKEQVFWKYLSEGEHLFETDFQEYKQYIEDRPFISSLERESPGRAGIWIGYNIVKQYVRLNNIKLTDLIYETDFMQIFKLSKYNP